MSANKEEFLKSEMINGWKLYWLITTPISAAIVIAMTRIDLSSAEGVSSMIQLAVRCSVPWMFIAFAASSVQTVFPGPFGRWLLRNRKFIGLCFATAMAWQLTFILWLVGIHTEYYVQDVYVLSDAIEGVIGYMLLIAMVLTSFRFGRSRLTSRQWKLLHTTAIYWLWIYAWSVYWFSLFYYESPAVLLDYFYYWGGLLAWCLRLLAWSKRRAKQSAASSVPILSLVTGVAAVGIGLLGSSFGSSWSPQVYEFLFEFDVIGSIDKFMPYFPLVPFYPLFIMALGAFILTRSRA